VKFLLLNYDYKDFLRQLYARNPGLEKRSYDEQMKARNESLFSVGNFFSNHLQRLGYEAWDIHANNEFLQKQWALEHGHYEYSPARIYNESIPLIKTARRIAGKTPLRRIKRLFQPLANWLDSRREEWYYSILEKQIKHYKPDVMLNMDITNICASFLRDVKHHSKLLVGIHAAPLPQDQDLSVYDLMISSLPNLVEFFRQSSIPSELLLWCFEPTVLEQLSKTGETIPVSFVGNISSAHSSRTKWLEDVCGSVYVDVWCNGVKYLPEDSPILKGYRGTVWGSEMYNILLRSRMTLNHHIDMAESYANNMRLFEATGVGTLLITDWKKNLREIFEPGGEVVTYRTPEECREKILYYLQHEDERAVIARAGQNRTLKDHTFLKRTEQLASIVKNYLH